MTVEHERAHFPFPTDERARWSGRRVGPMAPAAAPRHGATQAVQPSCALSD
jgi:hypothetical protein